MKKNNLLKIVNPLLALAFVSQALTGIFHTSVMKISYELFEYIHGYGGYVLVTLGIIHIGLNWNWIQANIFKKRHVQKNIEYSDSLLIILPPAIKYVHIYN